MPCGPYYSHYWAQQKRNGEPQSSGYVSLIFEPANRDVGHITPSQEDLRPSGLLSLSMFVAWIYFWGGGEEVDVSS